LWRTRLDGGPASRPQTGPQNLGAKHKTRQDMRKGGSTRQNMRKGVGKLVVKGLNDPVTEAAIAWMRENEAGNIKRAAKILETYKRPSQAALELAANPPSGGSADG